MTLELLVDGQLYSGWTDIRVARGMERAAADFSLTVSEQWPDRSEPWRILAGQPCEILIDDERIVNGYSDVYEPAYTADSHSVTIRGRSKVADLVDCAAVIEGGQFRGFTAAEIAETLAAPFGIGVVSEIPATPVVDIQIQQGETVFEILDRIAKAQGFLIGDTPCGDLLLYRICDFHADEAIEEGVNVLAARLTLDHSQVFSEYLVKGQQPWSEGLDGSDIREPSAAIVAAQPMRYRPHVIVSESSTDPASARLRAHWEARRRSGKAISVDITVQGWRQQAGPLWRENLIVPVTLPLLGVEDELVISDVEYSLMGAGQITHLRLTHPAAFEPEPVKPKRAAPARQGGAPAKAPAIDWSEYYDRGPR